MKALLALLLLTVLAMGQTITPESPIELRRYEVAWSPSASHSSGGDNLIGGTLDLSFHLTNEVAIVGDIGGHSATVNGTHLTLATYRLGPRFTLFRNDGTRTTVFVHVLAGGAQIIGSVPLISIAFNGSSFAMGGGVDIALKHWLTWRAIQPDYEYLHFGQASSNGFRLGSGLVFRFGSNHELF